MSDFYYIEQADVESYLGADLSDSNQKTFDLLLPLLQDTIDTYCNRSWNFTNPVTETFDAIQDGAAPYASTTFFVKYPSITAINSVTIGGSPWDLTYAFNYKTHVKLQTGPGSFLLPTPLGYQASPLATTQMPPRTRHGRLKRRLSSGWHQRFRPPLRVVVMSGRYRPAVSWCDIPITR
jgi:hypothetical protein